MRDISRLKTHCHRPIGTHTHLPMLQELYMTVDEDLFSVIEPKLAWLCVLVMEDFDRIWEDLKLDMYPNLRKITLGVRDSRYYDLPTRLSTFKQNVQRLEDHCNQRLKTRKSASAMSRALTAHTKPQPVCSNPQTNLKTGPRRAQIPAQNSKGHAIPADVRKTAPSTPNVPKSCASTKSTAAGAQASGAAPTPAKRPENVRRGKDALLRLQRDKVNFSKKVSLAEALQDAETHELLSVFLDVLFVDSAQALGQITAAPGPQCKAKAEPEATGDGDGSK